jgi:transcriptional regulator with XRE-family HTH domain
MKGSALKALRKQRGLTLRQLADFVGTTPERLGQIELTQDGVLTEYEVDRLVEALQVDRNVLLSPASRSYETAGGVGGNVKKLRVQRGLTQQALARQARLDKSIISQIEEDNKLDTIDTLYRLAEALHVWPSVLLNGAATDEMQRILDLLERKLTGSEKGHVVCPHCGREIKVK